MAFVNYQPFYQPDVNILADTSVGGFYEQDPPPDPSTQFGVDLVAHLRGLTAIYRDPADGLVKSQTTPNLGASWYQATVGVDPGSTVIAPSITVAPNDDLYAAWHDDTDTVKVAVSRDYGTTWEAVTTAPVLTGRYPRLLIAGDRHMVLFYSPADTATLLYGGSDRFETLEAWAEFAVSEQVPSFKQDRHGVIRVLAENAGDVIQYSSRDGIQWDEDGILISGREQPAGAGYVLASGAVFAWDAGDQLQVYQTTSDYGEVLRGPWDVTSAYPQQAPGVAVDRHGWVFLALQQVTGFEVTTDVSTVGRVTPDIPDIPRLAIDEDL